MQLVYMGKRDYTAELHSGKPTECDYFQINMFLLHGEVDPDRSVLHCRKGHN